MTKFGNIFGPARKQKSQKTKLKHTSRFAAKLFIHKNKWRLGQFGNMHESESLDLSIDFTVLNFNFASLFK